MYTGNQEGCGRIGGGVYRKQTAVISGMAKGVDSYAHTACLKAKGYTVAVLANGLDICYPSEHEKLKECIENKAKYTFQKID